MFPAESTADTIISQCYVAVGKCKQEPASVQPRAFERTAANDIPSTIDLCTKQPFREMKELRRGVGFVRPG